MGRFVKQIAVLDPNGDQLSVYMFEEVGRVPIVGLRRRVFRYELDTGESVQLNDDRSFKLTSGEELVCVENKKAHK